MARDTKKPRGSGGAGVKEVSRDKAKATSPTPTATEPLPAKQALSFKPTDDSAKIVPTKGASQPAPAQARTGAAVRDSRKLQFAIVDNTFKLLRTCVWAGVVVMLGYFVRIAIVDIAGKDTQFKAIVEAAINVDLSRWAAYLGCAVFGFAWHRERKLRKRTIADHAPYIKQLEQNIDPKRSGSGLTLTGEPSEEDRDG